MVQNGEPVRRSGEGEHAEFAAAQPGAASHESELIVRLIQRRITSGLSQAAVARRMQTSQSAIARLESRQHDVQLSTLTRYAEAVGLSLELAAVEPTEIGLPGEGGPASSASDERETRDISSSPRTPDNSELADEMPHPRQPGPGRQDGSLIAEHEGPGLTRRQRAILGFWRDYTLRNGYPPSYREIAAGVGLASVSSVVYQVRQLEKTGYISREAGRSRAAALRSGDEGIVEIPFVGRIAAGGPMLAWERAEDVLALPEQLVGKGDFILLRAVGDSMINAAIVDGDLLVVRRDTDIDSGDIVAAMLPADRSSTDWEATVKTLRKLDGHVWLVPENPNFEPIPGGEASIIGKVVCVLRRL